MLVGDRRAGAACTVDDLIPLLARRDLPELARLGLQSTELADELCTVLPDGELIPQLAELSLAFGTMTDEGARALARARDKLAHLATLDVHGNYIENLGILDGCARKVHSLGQRDAPRPGARRQVMYTLWKEGEAD